MLTQSQREKMYQSHFRIVITVLHFKIKQATYPLGEVHLDETKNCFVSYLLNYKFSKKVCDAKVIAKREIHSVSHEMANARYDEFPVFLIRFITC